MCSFRARTKFVSSLELFFDFRYTFATLFRPVIDQGFTFLGMQYTSASFASALMNAVPSVTFVLAVIFR
jgi:drug/metabolite transporter (DMT)-like permease